MKIKEKYDKEFFWVCFKIGLGVLAYRLGIEIFSTTAILISVIFAFAFSEATSLVNVVTQLSVAVASVMAFAIGAAVLWISLHIGKRRNYQKTHKRLAMPWTAPFMVIAAVAINFTVAELNSFIISYISSGTLVEITEQTAVGISFAEVLAMLFSSAVVPAICEEIAFRGLILTNLEPYGKGTAILGSALLFGLMHMNPAQFLYTTVLGLVIGLVYVKTKNIWICMIIHFVNNGLAVVKQILYYQFDMNIATIYDSVLTLVIVLLGAVSILILAAVHRRAKKRTPAEIGSFGRIYDADLGYEAHQVTKNKKVLLFFSSTVSVFTAIVFFMMGLSVFLSIFGMA